MCDKLINETACAVLSLSTRAAWTADLPQPMPRRAVRRMLETGALEGLVLRDTPEVEEKWFERARALLVRVSDVHDRVEAYGQAGYRILLRGDALWPRGLRALGSEEPLFLFVKGELPADGRMISVAGSRRILSETQCAAEATGRMIARENAVLVTGGAIGVDSAELCGALDAGGCAVIVPAMPAARLLGSKTLDGALECGRLTLLCDTLPDEPFSAAKALSRNHTIYALGDASLVVAARDGRGGSWRGATDCLRGSWSPVYVWNGENPDTAGNRALEHLGAGKYDTGRPLSAQLAARQRQTSLFEGA